MAKIGTGHLMGMFRKGFVELGEYVQPSHQGGIHSVEDPGIWPNQTQGEVADGRKLTLDDLRAYANEKAEEADRRMDRGREDDHDLGDERE